MNAQTSTTATLPAPRQPADPDALTLDRTLVSLAAAEARRFARHPVFLGGAVLLVGLSAILGVTEHGPDKVSGGLVLSAFFLGVFGFVAAHRLTTSTRRSLELVDTAPVARQRRTLALCLACLVPGAAALLWLGLWLAMCLAWPPRPVPPGQHALWFGDASSVDLLAIMIEGSVVAALGGALLGVAVATWAPFRGSAVLGPIVLVTGVLMLVDQAYPTYSTWAGLSPFTVQSDDVVVHGVVQSTSSSSVAVPVWHAVYALGLSGLAAVAALLRDAPRRRPLFVTGAALVAVSAVALTLNVS